MGHRGDFGETRGDFGETRGDFGETRGFFGETLPKKWLVEPIEFCNYIYVIYI
jgi:hypothetical protein